MWRLINGSAHNLSWCLCDIFTCFKAPECWHRDYFVYILDALYCIVSSYHVLVYIFSCWYKICMSVCCMTTFLLHGTWFGCLCGIHMHPLTLIHIAQSTHSLFSFFFYVFETFPCIFSLQLYFPYLIGLYYLVGNDLFFVLCLLFNRASD